MNNGLMIRKENEELRITSLELVDIINQFRKVESETIGKQYKELKHKDFMKKIRKELEVLKTLGLEDKGIEVESYIDKQNQERPCFSLNSQGLKYIMDTCRSRDKIAMAQIFNEMTNGREVSVCKNRPEHDFIDGLINSLKAFGIEEYKTQYVIKNDKGANYKIDLYLPELNIAIEYDENGHKNYTYEQQEGRQKEIEQELGCKFIRVSDKDNLFYNIGLVIKEIVSCLRS